MTNPSWYEHVDLMQVIIVLLILIVAWFIRRDFTRFEAKLESMCASINKKGDADEVKRKANAQENDEEHEELWKRVNHHKHVDVTGEVVIAER